VHKVINNSEISFFAVCTCCPVDNNQTNVYPDPEDSAWIKEQAR